MFEHLIGHTIRPDDRPDDFEPIREIFTSAGQVREHILLSSESRVASLGWGEFGIPAEKRRPTSRMSEAILNASGISWPACYVSVSLDPRAPNRSFLVDYLRSVPDSRRTAVERTKSRILFVVMNQPEILPDQANAMRDYLTVEQTKAVAERNGIAPGTAVQYLLGLEDDRAGLDPAMFLGYGQRRPEFL